jgi:hypothetical protein
MKPLILHSHDLDKVEPVRLLKRLTKAQEIMHLKSAHFKLEKRNSQLEELVTDLIRENSELRQKIKRGGE